MQRIIPVRRLTGIPVHHQPNRAGIRNLATIADHVLTIDPRSQLAGAQSVRGEIEHRALPKVEDHDPHDVAPKHDSHQAEHGSHHKAAPSIGGNERRDKPIDVLGWSHASISLPWTDRHKRLIHIGGLAWIVSKTGLTSSHAQAWLL